MGLNRTEGDPYAPVRVSASITLDPANDCYGVSATLGTPVTVTTPPAFAHRSGAPFCAVGDRWKVYDLGLNASTQPIAIAAGAGMAFVGGATSLSINSSGSAVQLTVLDDGVTIQVDLLNGTVSPPVAPFPNPFLTQANWYFDFANTTGLASDSNSGADATHPLLTYNGGFIPRVGTAGGGPWQVLPILHFMSTQPSATADVIVFNPVVPISLGIPQIVGTVTAKVAAGNLLSAVTPKNRTAPANGQLLTLTFQGGAAGNVVAGDFLQNTTGSKVSNSWARTNVGTNQFTAFQPLTPAGPSFPTLHEFDTWAAGDTVQVSSIPKVYVDTLAGILLVQNVEVAGATAGANLNGAIFMECRISAGIDPNRTKSATFINCPLSGGQFTRNVAPALTLQGGGTLATTLNLGAGSSLDYDTYLGTTTGGSATSLHGSITIIAAYFDNGGVTLVDSEFAAEITNAQVAGTPFFWGPGAVDVGGTAELLINPGQATATILNQGGALGAVTVGGVNQGLFLDTTVNPAVWSGLRNITAALLDTDGHAGGGFREGAAGAVSLRGSQGAGSIRSGSI